MIKFLQSLNRFYLDQNTHIQKNLFEHLLSDSKCRFRKVIFPSRPFSFSKKKLTYLSSIMSHQDSKKYGILVSSRPWRQNYLGIFAAIKFRRFCRFGCHSRKQVLKIFKIVVFDEFFIRFFSYKVSHNF